MTQQTTAYSTKQHPALAYEIPQNAKQCDECGGCQATDEHRCDVLVRDCPECHHTTRVSVSTESNLCPNCDAEGRGDVEMVIRACGGTMVPLLTHD